MCLGPWLHQLLHVRRREREESVITLMHVCVSVFGCTGEGKEWKVEKWRGTSACVYESLVILVCGKWGRKKGIRKEKRERRGMRREK